MEVSFAGLLALSKRVRCWYCTTKGAVFFMSRAFLASVAALVAFWVLTPRLAEGQAPVNSYSVTEVGPYSDINDLGHLVGYTYVDEWSWTYHASLTVDGTTVDLGSLGGELSSAISVNNKDQVVGWSSLWGDTESHAFLWDPTLGMMDLGTVGGSYSDARGINDAGQVVGISNTVEGTNRAFLWQNGQMVALPLPPGYTGSEAYGINESGQVVGIAYDATTSRPFRWTPSVPNGTTGTLELLSTTAGGSANAINAAGDTVGRLGSQAVLWPGSGGPAVVLSTSMSAYARSINDSRVVVGAGPTGFVWDPVNGTRDLNRLADMPTGVMLDSADAVTASGLILAYRYDYGGFLLTPSPVPSYPRDLLDAGVGGLSLTWSASPGATSYNIKRWIGTDYSVVGTVTGTSYKNASIPNSQAGLYVVSAVNSYGQSANSDPAFSRPVPPTNLTASTGKGKGAISLKWKASTAWAITQYRIYRSTTNGGGYTLRSTVGQVTSFADTSLPANATYYYVVTAVNGSGRESIYSNQASATAR
jgi:probable HAF family extracellular repeat protein